MSDEKTVDNVPLTWYNPDIETNQEDNNTMWHDSLTTHGFERAQERIKGGGALKIEKRIKKVLEKGKRIEDYSDDAKFQKYLMNVKNARDPSNDLRVFGNDIYLFSQRGALITVLNIPAKILAQRARRKS